MNTKTVESTDYAEILELLKHYYEGLYRIDAPKLRAAFSPSARYATIVGGSLLELSIDDYLARLQRREPPEKQGTPYQYHVASIRLAGDNTALAELGCSLFDHDYTDFLSLLRINGRWRIQAKVFEGAPRNNREAL